MRYCFSPSFNISEKLWYACPRPTTPAAIARRAGRPAAPRANPRARAHGSSPRLGGASRSKLPMHQSSRREQQGAGDQMPFAEPPVSKLEGRVHSALQTCRHLTAPEQIHDARIANAVEQETLRTMEEHDHN